MRHQKKIRILRRGRNEKGGIGRKEQKSVMKASLTQLQGEAKALLPCDHQAGSIAQTVKKERRSVWLCNILKRSLTFEETGTFATPHSQNE